MLWQDCPIGCGEAHEEDGIIQRYIHLTREFEAPTSYHVFSLLTAVAAATSRRVLISRGGYELWPNLYTLLHGPSGIGKGIASDHAMKVVRHAAGDMLREYPEDLTGEGLFTIMVNQTKEDVPCIGLVYADEFADLLGGQDYKAEFAKRLTRLYSCPDKQGVGRATKGERWVRWVFLNILGCSQEDWLRTLPIHAVKGGLFARFLTVPEEEARFRRFTPDVDKDFGLAVITELSERLKTIEKTVIKMTPEAFEFGEEWYSEIDARIAKFDPVVKPWCERQLDHAIKLGYLNTLLEGDQCEMIDVEGLEWGINVVEWLAPRIEAAFMRMDETKVGELHRQAAEMVARNGKMAESRLRAGLGNKWSKGQIDEALHHLVEVHKIRRYMETMPGGKNVWMLEVKRDETA
jgi:hypothetical protein